MARLVALVYSPWSEKARWALDHHRIPYDLEDYVPMLGEPMLRVRLRRPFGRVSVPAWIDGEDRITDSFAIARHADRIGSGSSLFPAGSLDTIERWNERSEVALAAGRALVVKKTSESRPAMEAALPKYIPSSLRPFLADVSRMGISFLRAKYGVAKDMAEVERTIIEVLEELRTALDGRAYLMGELSYADIVMAVVLQLVRPVSDDYIPLAPATRETWTHRPFEARFADLCEWRDALYAKHRRP
jgi:glutathione S-transferase